MAKSKTQPLNYIELESNQALKVCRFLQDKLNQIVEIISIECWLNTLYVEFFYYKEYPEHGKFQQRFVSYKVINETSDKAEPVKAPAEQQNQQAEPAVQPAKLAPEIPSPMPKVVGLTIDDEWKAYKRGRPQIFSEKKFLRVLKQSFSSAKKEHGNNMSYAQKILKETMYKIEKEISGFYKKDRPIIDQSEIDFSKSMRALGCMAKMLGFEDLQEIKAMEKINTSKKLVDLLQKLESKPRKYEGIPCESIKEELLKL